MATPFARIDCIKRAKDSPDGWNLNLCALPRLYENLRRFPIASPGFPHLREPL
jgi:hypothetical protein